MKLPIFSKSHGDDGGDLFLVVGLGNPGDEYANTRHNIGFMAVREFSRGLEDPDKARRRYSGKWREGWFGGRRLATLLPHTFMNRSGEAVHLAASRKHVPPGNIIIVHDDMDFPFGTVRTRLGGGSGGHRGLDSITRKLGTADYARVRIGIGRPEDPDEDVRDWVLSEFSEEQSQLPSVIETASECVAAIIADGIEAAMNRFNRRDE